MIFLVNDTLLLLFIENWLLLTFLQILFQKVESNWWICITIVAQGLQSETFSGLGSSAAEGIKDFGL